jgi:hypothetical protein
MKENTSHKNPEKHDDSECAGNYLSAQDKPTCPSAADGTPADGQVGNNVSTKIYPDQNNDRSMAESVTRHTLISSVDKIEYLTCPGWPLQNPPPRWSAERM